MIEVEAIVNARPLTPILIDFDINVPLTPNHLLLLRQGASCFPFEFTKSKNYSSRRWRQVQYLADEFWRRWTREYLSTLQIRSKWQNERDNFKMNDIVLVHDENAPREMWPLGKIVEMFPDCHARVRQVLVRTQFSTLRRPITKLLSFTVSE